jgi:hypothetical protein
MKSGFQLLCLILLTCLAVLLVLTPHLQGRSADAKAEVLNTSHPILVTNLRNTVTNFGSFGSPEGLLPSCEWEAGSNNFYLNDGELWVGAVALGDTAVTTGRFSGQEWSPVEEIDVMTGMSAFSDEDTYTRYFDLEEPPGESDEHLPLGIQVSQRTYAWEDRDFIVHDLLIENVGLNDLTGVYVGFCWDFNIASAAGGNYHRDDLVGLDEAGSISYMFDADGDKGLSPGYVGGKFLNTPLAGHWWWNSRQDPDNDSERYQRLSGGLKDDPDKKKDYRLLQSVGPFDIPAGGTIPLLYALAIGDGLGGLVDAIGDAEEMLGLDTAAAGDSTLYDGGIHEIAVGLGETKRYVGRVQMAVDWEFCTVAFSLEDPLGRPIDPQVAQASPFINFTAGPHRQSYDIVNPMTGEWKLIIEYIEGPGLIEYSHSVVLSQLPYDFGLPMENFLVTEAYINFETAEKGAPSVSSLFRVFGEMALRPGVSFDCLQDPVILQMGSYQETIPPGAFTPQGEPGNETYNYSNPDPEHAGIHHMIFNFKKGWFRAYACRVDMTGTGNPVLVRLAIGPNTGFEGILMEVIGNEWFYELEGKTNAEPLIAEASLPAAFSLSQNYPNPFNPATEIRYAIPKDTHVTLKVYNVMGAEVTNLVDGDQSAGAYTVRWDARDLSNGVYFCRLLAGEFSMTVKMVLLK